MLTLAFSLNPAVPKWSLTELLALSVDSCYQSVQPSLEQEDLHLLDLFFKMFIHGCVCVPQIHHCHQQPSFLCLPSK